MTWLCWALLLAQQPPVTFSKDVAPVLDKHCIACHRAGEAAPFALVTYEDAAKRAAQIAAVTRRRYMPPWPPEPGHGDFAGARRLTVSELEVLQRWAATGAPRGDSNWAPKPLPKTPEWQLGTPDLVLSLNRPFALAAEGTDVFRNFVIRNSLKETRHIRAIELRPGRRDLVHHANVIVDRSGRLRTRDGEDGNVGFEGMEVTTEAEGRFDPDSHFLFWKPGTAPETLPESMAWRLDPGDDLVLNLHLKPSGKPESVEASVGLYFAKGSATERPMLLQLEHDGAIDLAPGSKATIIGDHLVLPVAAKLLAIYPHAHYLGQLIEAWADLPGGKRRSLLRIAEWDIQWQGSYTYRQPVLLPAGTRLGMRIVYDNSAGNARNPNRPPKRVQAGNRSEDEMGHVWFQVLPEGGGTLDPRLKLQLALMRRRLEKYPNDFFAHFNLGTAMQAMGDDAGAIGVLNRALAIRPESAAAHNNLGTSLLLTDRPGSGLEFQRAVELDSSYAAARYNWARSLMADGDVNGAVREFGTYLKQRPADAEAHVHLGGLYAARGDFSLAAAELSLAAALRPGDAELWTNLGTAQALAGDLRAAVASWEAALRIEPKLEAARQNLDRAKAELKR